MANPPSNFDLREFDDWDNFEDYFDDVYSFGVEEYGEDA